MPKDVSVIIPAYNEENNIEAAIKCAIESINNLVDDYEILVINDGSTDTTKLRAEALMKTNQKIRVYSNERNMGYGCSLRRGFQCATKNYLSCYPGDNDVSMVSMRDLMQNLGEADCIATYILNKQKRSIFRRIVSKSFVMLMNGLFGLKLKYFNGPFIFKRAVIQSLTLRSNGFDVIAECLIRMIRAGYGYKEVGIEHTGRKTGQSKAISFNSVFRALRSIAILFKDIYFSPRLGSNRFSAVDNKI